MATKRKKIYVFSVKDFTDEDEAIALSESGIMICHCSYYTDDKTNNEPFIPYIFGVVGKTTNFHREYVKVYPFGYELEYVKINNIKNHKELNSALKKFAFFGE